MKCLVSGMTDVAMTAITAVSTWANLLRAEVRHPLAGGTAGHTSMDTGLTFGPIAALTNPIFLGKS